MRDCPECGKDALYFEWNDYGHGFGECYNCSALVEQYPHDKRLLVKRGRGSVVLPRPYFVNENGTCYRVGS